MQNLFLFSAEYQSGRLIYRNIILYFVLWIFLFPVNPWRWLTIKMKKGRMIFFAVAWVSVFISGEGNRNMGSREGWAGSKIVDWFSWSRKSGNEQGQGSTSIPDRAAGSEVLPEGYTRTRWKIGTGISCLSEYSLALQVTRKQSWHHQTTWAVTMGILVLSLGLVTWFHQVFPT